MQFEYFGIFSKQNLNVGWLKILVKPEWSSPQNSKWQKIGNISRDFLIVFSCDLWKQESHMLIDYESRQNDFFNNNLLLYDGDKNGFFWHDEVHLEMLFINSFNNIFMPIQNYILNPSGLNCQNILKFKYYIRIFPKNYSHSLCDCNSSHGS